MKVLRSCLTASLLFISLYQITRVTVWPSAPTEGDFSIGLIGKQLLTTYALPFEVVSLVLLVAIIGTLVISGSKESGS
jgi:NADH-quinone oxidoreductase subunit J